MTRVIVYCEGPTEETFVNRILAPAFWNRNIYLSAHPCNGVSKYSIIRKWLSDLCKSDPSATVTTMLDYYGLPSDTPGMRDAIGGTIYDKVAHVEKCISEDIGATNFVPNLLIHEFEALLFSDPTCFEFCGLSSRAIEELCKIRASAETPEHINNNPNTAPSKRIQKLYPEYIKPLDGINVAQDIGLSKMRAECKHFDEWISVIESLEPQK